MHQNPNNTKKINKFPQIKKKILKFSNKKKYIKSATSWINFKVLPEKSKQKSLSSKMMLAKQKSIIYYKSL